MVQQERSVLLNSGKMLSTLIILVTCTTIQLAAAALVDIQPCPRSDPNLKECIKGNLATVFREWKNGSKYFGIEPLDPGQSHDVKFSYEAVFGPVDFYLEEHFTYFLSEGQVLDVRIADINDSTVSLEVKVFYSRVFMKGRYNVDSRWIVPYRTNGTYRVNITNIASTWRISGKLVTVAGQEYMQIQHFLVEPLPETVLLFFSNLLPGERLNWFYMRLLNNFWEMFAFVWLSSFTAAWDGRLTELANKVFLKVPYDELFPK